MNSTIKYFWNLLFPLTVDKVVRQFTKAADDLNEVISENRKVAAQLEAKFSAVSQEIGRARRIQEKFRNLLD